MLECPDCKLKQNEINDYEILVGQKDEQIRKYRLRYETLRRNYDPDLATKHDELKKKSKAFSVDYKLLKNGLEQAKVALNKVVTSYPFIELELDDSQEDDSDYETFQERTSTSRASTSRTSTSRASTSRASTSRASTSRATTSRNETRSPLPGVNTYKLLINEFYITNTLHLKKKLFTYFVTYQKLEKYSLSKNLIKNTFYIKQN